MKKITWDFLSVELTRKCQINCKHCFKGKCQNVTIEKRNNMGKRNFRKSDIDTLIANSHSSFSKERYENHVDLMDKLYKKVNNSLENVRSDYRIAAIKRYMEWFDEWFSELNNEESDIINFALGHSIRNVTDYFNGTGDLLLEKVNAIKQMVDKKSEEYVD